MVDVVDVILEDSGIDEKFLGVTLFALVPNTTEFMNAISFALNGNIALRYAFASASPIRLLTIVTSIVVWRSAQHMHFKFVSSKSRQWLLSPLGTTLKAWVKWQKLSRKDLDALPTCLV